MIDYSKVMKHHTVYDWQIEMQKEYKKKQKLEEIEVARLEEKRIQAENAKTEEFITFYKKHPISDEIIEQLKLIEPSKRARVNPVYFLDKQLNIIGIVESKNLVGSWIYKNGYRNKILGRTTVFEYIRNRRLYKDKLYFVPCTEYQDFLKKN
ncbi:hypothetical protein [Peribacillus butanolivorans]|uniref:hypothetical protein n=1 Tax=Peribacillus butanolivorans TaxID=421767 RepID=UPI00364BF840